MGASNNESYLQNNPFEVVELSCYAGAKKISAYLMSETPESRTVDPGVRFTFEMLLTAICHKINWDFLNDALREPLMLNTSRDIAMRAAQTTSEDVKKWLAGYEKPVRIRATERAAMIREVGTFLLQQYDGESKNMYVSSKGMISGDSGILSQLDRIKVFSEDPLRKKANILIQEIVRGRIFEFRDTATVKPAIDYHIMRIYLRSGRVISKIPPEAEHYLRGGSDPRPRFVKLFREKTAEALSLTAHFSKLSIPDVNYIEWVLGRNVCLPNKPLCNVQTHGVKLPEDIKSLCNPDCPHTDFCWTYNQDKSWENRQEPNYKGSAY